MRQVTTMTGHTRVNAWAGRTGAPMTWRQVSGRIGSNASVSSSSQLSYANRRLAFCRCESQETPSAVGIENKPPESSSSETSKPRKVESKSSECLHEVDTNVKCAERREAFAGKYLGLGRHVINTLFLSVADENKSLEVMRKFSVQYAKR